MPVNYPVRSTFNSEFLDVRPQARRKIISDALVLLLVKQKSFIQIRQRI
jgi:hypothetical protein